ncbi:hypothetical protein D3C80_2113910 [compost metagenome]
MGAVLRPAVLAHGYNCWTVARKPDRRVAVYGRVLGSSMAYFAGDESAADGRGYGQGLGAEDALD